MSIDVQPRTFFAAERRWRHCPTDAQIADGVCSYIQSTSSAAWAAFSEPIQVHYALFIREGWEQGRIPELTGGGLIRSLGGWSALKKIRFNGQDRIKGDERILGDSEFVLAVLEEANEKLECRYELKSRGFDLKDVQMRVTVLLDVASDRIYSKGRRRDQVEARSLFCYLAVRELGYSITELARRVDMTQPAVGYAVNRGEQIATERGISMLG